MGDTEIEKVKLEIEELKLEIKDVKREIEEVKHEIEKKERDIEAVDKQLEAAPSIDGASDFRNEKSQLQDKGSKLQNEKSQLRDKENKLRDKENKLLAEKNKLRDKENELRKDKRLREEENQPGLAGGLPQAPQCLQSFVRGAAMNYNNLLPGENQDGKFLLVSQDLFEYYKDPFLIWIRKCYCDLKDVILETLASTQNLHRRFVILGTEGIGKSFFTIFWICYLATRRVKVVWKTHPEQIFILDFSQEVATVSGPFKDYIHDAIQSVVDDPFAWLILDGQQLYCLPYKCHMLLVCSAEANNYVEFLKGSQAKRLYLPVWVEEEMDQFCDDFSLYRHLYGAMDVPVKEKVQANFMELGGVPRYVLNNQKMEEGRALFEEAILKLNEDLCWKLLHSIYEKGLSEKIMHLDVGDVEGNRKYDTCVYMFACRKALESVWNKLYHQPPTFVKHISNH